MKSETRIRLFCTGCGVLVIERAWPVWFYGGAVCKACEAAADGNLERVRELLRIR